MIVPPGGRFTANQSGQHGSQARHCAIAIAQQEANGPKQMASSETKGKTGAKKKGRVKWPTVPSRAPSPHGGSKKELDLCRVGPILSPSRKITMHCNKLLGM